MSPTLAEARDARAWSGELLRACERLVRDGNCSGVYRQWTRGRPCYPISHPVGGGIATDSLRAICQAIRDAMQQHYPEAALSVRFSTKYLDVTDHRLQLQPVVGLRRCGRRCNDYTVTYGRTLASPA